jgi:hypothetical protein
MKYRKLRIAWSVAWGIACLLLIVLWVRSIGTWVEKSVPLPNGYALTLRSIQGHIFMGVGRSEDVYLWEFSTYCCARLTEFGAVAANDSIRLIFTQKAESAGFGFGEAAGAWHVFGPQWILSLLLGTTAVLPWIRQRYSVRTLLIVITLISIALGVISNLARS